MYACMYRLSHTHTVHPGRGRELGNLEHSPPREAPISPWQIILKRQSLSVLLLFKDFKEGTLENLCRRQPKSK